MKYKAIIADDEWKIIQLIRRLGHWEKLDIEIVDECLDGEEALESILTKKPDFVLSDIKMPGLDGIELIEKVKEQDQKVLFVLLSGYRYFEYARSAVKLNVVDYLLKPVDEQQLNEILEKVCRNIDQIRQQENNQEQLKNFQTENLAKKQERFWKMMFENQLPKNILHEKDLLREEFGVSFSNSCFQVICMDTNLFGILNEEHSAMTEKISLTIAKLFRDLADIVLHWDFRGFALILNFEEKREEDVEKAISTLFYSIRDLNELYGDFRLCIGCSEILRNPDSLEVALEQAYLASWGRMIFIGNQIIRYSKVKYLPEFDSDQVLSEKQAREITECIKICQSDELSGIFSDLYHNAAQYNNSSVRSMLTVYQRLQRAVLQAFSEKYAESVRKHIFLAVQNSRNFQQIFKKVYEYLSRYIEEEQSKRDLKMSKPIEDTIRYIKRNYSQGISLEDAADAVNVSASYLSRIFKEKTGTGFSEYLTQIRLEESQKLLTGTNFSIKEIALQVGYIDEKYYSKIFKKITGIKPTDYRKLYG